jgi:excisionase family DNA binding protein
MKADYTKVYREEIRQGLAPAMQLETLSRRELLTVGEVAALYGICAGTLNNMRTQGRGPKFVKFGRTVRYRRQDLNAYFEANLEITYDQR